MTRAKLAVFALHRHNISTLSKRCQLRLTDQKRSFNAAVTKLAFFRYV